jgi:hypothetical protein
MPNRRWPRWERCYTALEAFPAIEAFCQRDLRLGLEADRLGHMRLVASLGIVGPVLRQIKRLDYIDKEDSAFQRD